MPEGAPKNPNYNPSKDCIENLVIPPQLPQILKLYTKAAMRTQPPNLLKWTHTYMQAMADGRQPPVKDRGEVEPIQRSPAGLTPGFLRVLNQQLRTRNPDGSVSADDVLRVWDDMSFNPNDIRGTLDQAELSGGRRNDWRKVLVCLANTIPSGGDVAATMRIVCEALTEQAEGAEPYINYQTWWELYVYLAKVVRQIGADTIERVNSYLQQVSKGNFNLIGPRDFINNPSCPPLA